MQSKQSLGSLEQPQSDTEGVNFGESRNDQNHYELKSTRKNVGLTSVCDEACNLSGDLSVSKVIYRESLLVHYELAYTPIVKTFHYELSIR